MNATLIAYDSDVTSLVKEAMQACSLSLHDALQRRPDDSLAPLLNHLEGGILVLESSRSHVAMDLEALQWAIRQHPLLHVILLCDDDSKDLLMQAMRVGVRDVLPLRPAPSTLVQCLQRWADSQITAQASAPPKGQLIVFLGCKGGTGTSFLAANMAWLTAAEFGQRCAFIDLDLQSGDASFYLSSGNCKNDLSDLTRQIDRLDAQLLTSCLHAVNDKLNLLAAPATPESAIGISAQDIGQVLTLAQQQHHFVVVDVARTLNALSLKALDMASVICIVMQNTTPDVRDARRLVKTLLSLGYDESRLRLIVNRYEPDSWVSLKDVEKTAGLAVSYTLPDNPKWVGEALHLGKPLALVNDYNTVVHALRETTADLLRTNMPSRHGWISRWIGKAA